MRPFLRVRDVLVLGMSQHEGMLETAVFGPLLFIRSKAEKHEVTEAGIHRERNRSSHVNVSPEKQIFISSSTA